MKKLFLHILILIAFFLIGNAYASGCKKAIKVSIKGQRIYVNGKLYFIKGICYNPFYPNRGNGPLAFTCASREEKERDFRLIKEAGFNTIRIYAPMPDEFYDLADKYGLKIIEPILNTGSYLNVKNHNTLKECINSAISRVKKMKNHPSILMWSLWNDAPFHNNIVERYGKRNVNKFYKKIYEAVKQIDKNHPITGANMINAKNGWDMGFKYLDVIGCNTYLGLDYSGHSWKYSEFSKIAAKHTINRLKKFSKKYKKPVIITEFGFPTHRYPKKQGKVILEQIKIINEKIAGICLFEFTDEWWKSGLANVQDSDIEDNWGIMTAYRKPKKGYLVIKEIFNKTKTESLGFSQDLFIKKFSRKRPHMPTLHR